MLLVLIFGLNFFFEFEFELVVVVVVVAVFSVPTNRFEVGEGVLNASSSLELSSFVCSGGGEKGEIHVELFSFSSFSSAIATIIRCCFILCFVHHHLGLILLVYYYQKSNTIIPGSSLEVLSFVLVSLNLFSFFVLVCDVFNLTVSIYSSLKKRKEVSKSTFSSFTSS